MKHHALVLATSLLALTVAACDNDPSKGKAQATVAAPASTAAAAPASAVNHAFSNVDSKIAFVGAKVTRKHDGSFETFTGAVNLAENDPEKSRVTAEIDVASLKTDEEKLTAHLKSSDLLDVAKYPKAKFVSTSVKRRGDNGAYTVTGNLELHGVTKSITFPATIKAEGDAVTVDAEFAINRKDFGVVYPGMPDDLIKDDVLLKLRIRAAKAADKNVGL